MIPLALVACTPSRDALLVDVPAEHLPVFESFAAYADHPGLSVSAGAPGARVELVEDEPGTEAYRIESDGRTVTVHGSDVLGLQYGLADVLEQMGFRFLHPTHTVVPVTFETSAVAPTGHVEPETARRGLHLHTLHPIEAELDLVEGLEGGEERSRRIVDWIVKNRGNHLQWPLLDDIVEFPGLAPPWQERIGALVEEAHARGVDIGLGVQLFGSGNLQQAFDLIDGSEVDPAEIDARIATLAPVRPDVISLSFGEFSGEDPQVFVDTGNDVVRRIHEAMPDAEVVTTLHVGNYDDLRIEWEGEEILYYFLGAELDDVTPWVHSVMYYDLYEDAGGAYLHDEFDEHRAFLEGKLAAGEPVGYHPESAYWVAFDNSVPTFLPIYLRTRFTDLDRLRPLSLQDHVTFSSGWEWGYWQTDQQILRWNHTLPDDWESSVRWTWAPWGPAGEELAEIEIELADLQHASLLEGRLAAYLASRDGIIDIGDDLLGILSQPDRPRPHEIVAMTPAELDEVQVAVDGLFALADGTDALVARAEGLGDVDPWFAEVKDGLAIDALRARFAAHVHAGAVALGRGGDGSDDLAAAEGLLAEARAVVERRHAALHWTGGDRILATTDENATIYRYGYLGKADELCYWERERIQLANLVRGTDESVPPCT